MRGDLTAIRGYVVLDTTCSGVIDGNSFLLDGVTVKLYNATTGALVATTVTDSTLFEYAYIDIPAGTYRVTYDLPLGYDSELVIPGSGAITPVGKDAYIVVAASGVVYQDNDFLICTTSTGLGGQSGGITGKAYCDDNGNSTFNAGEVTNVYASIQF